MCSKEPGCEDGTAAAPVEVAAAGMADAAEELGGEVELADLAVRLGGEGRDHVGLVGVGDRLG